jgi:hypothetical protein
LDDLLIRIASDRSLDISALRAADTRTESTHSEFHNLLKERLPSTSDYSKVDVILTGSFARRELTAGSDCDYIITSLETVEHDVMPTMVHVVEGVMTDLQFMDPGAQGVFGDFTPAGDLIWRIGLDSDSNINITRRALILTESVSVLNPDVRLILLEKILSRYCADYISGYRQVQDGIKAPRFLLNDVIRYWRTIAVDFGAKQWRLTQADMGLRHAKLLTTRKILFAGSLMALFLAQSSLSLDNEDDQGAYDKLKAYLSNELSKPPLARLLAAYDRASGQAQEAMARILSSYSSFIGILDRPDTRRLLKADPEGSAEAKGLLGEIHTIGEEIESGLEVVFFDDPTFAPLTRRYGLF